MINPTRHQPTRMMGLASGMDTDFIIQQTLRLHQFKIDNQMRSKKLIEWRQQNHNTIRDEIASLRSTFLSNLGSKSMMSRNAFNASTATITGANSSAVSIRTNAGTPLGNFRIDSVTQLAKGAHLQTTGNVTGINGNGFASTTRLGDMNFAGGEKIDWNHQGGTIRVGNENVKIELRTSEVEVDVFDDDSVKIGTEMKTVETWSFKDSKGNDVAFDWEGDKLTLDVGGTTRTLNWDAANNRFTEDRPNIMTGDFTIPPKEAGDDDRSLRVTTNLVNGEWRFSTNISGVTVTLDEDTGNLLVMEGDTEIANLGKWDADEKTIDDKDLTQQTQPALNLVGEAVLTFNSGDSDTAITIRATDSIGDVMNRVNNSSAGLSMSYDRLTDQFTLETKRMGDDVGDNLVLSAGNSNFFSLISGNGASGTISTAGGQDAVVKVNGETIRRNTNSFDFRGVGITLNSTFAEEMVGDRNINEIGINITRDTNKAFNAIKDFIDSYNSIIKRLEGLLNERKTGNEVAYKPLTDEEKQGMTDRQIQEWEDIARKGIMRGDQGIQNLVSNLRRTFFEEIEGMGMSPAQLGLTTGSYFDGTGGQIMINEERLRDALERDPDMVADVFIRIDNSGSSPKGVGLLHKIDNMMRDYMNTTSTTSLKNLESSLKRANDQIARLQERMFAEEDRLYRQFAAMESAMSKLNQQGDWFSAMLG